MNRILLLSVLFSLIFNLSGHAEWIPLKGSTKASPAGVTLLSDNSNSTVIRVDISGFNLNEFTAGGKTYHSADFMDEIFTSVPASTEAGAVMFL